MSLNWYHKRPRDYYKRCVELFGKPTALSKERGGIAIWKTRGLFSEHILRDEDVKHCVPRPHHDYFYSSVKFFVPKDKLLDVLKISGSLNYDGLKKLLTARCGGIGANYATIYLGMLVANGKLTIKDVKKDHLYPRMIRGEIIPHNKLHSIMYKLKKANNKKYKKLIDAEYADYAYDKCYVPKKIINTRNEPCSKKDWTSCCPHNAPDGKGRYRATNEKSILVYKGKKYQLYTCCTFCADSMIKTAKKNPKKFNEIYISRFDDKGNMIAKNQHTGVVVQKLKLIK